MIPPTSLEEELSKVDWKERRKTARSLDHADVQEEEEGEESELPTPVTPAVERTKSFIAALARLPNSPLTVTIPAVPSIPRMLPPPPMLLPKHPRLSSLPSPPMALPMHPRLSSLPSHFTPHTPASSHPDSATTPRPPFDLPLPPPPQEFFRRPSVQAQVDLLVLKASGSAPPDLPLPPTPAAPMKLSAEALQKQTELERLDIDKWRAQVLAEAEAERAIEEEREREEERARVQARIRLEQEELEQVLAVEDRERERVRERDRNAERQGRGEEYMNRLTVVDPEESMVKLEMSMAKLEAYAPAPAQKEEVKGASETVQVIPIDISRESSILSPSPRPPPNTPNTPNSVSTSRTSSKLHHETSSKPTVPPKDSAFVKRIRPRQAKSSAPPTSWMPEGPTPSSSSTSGGLALPKFDFEAPDHKVLDIRGLGLRAESRLGYRPSVEDVPEVPPEAPTQDQQNDEELDHEPVLLVPLRRRPSCLPDLRTNASLVSIDDTGISSTYSTISAGTAAEAQRAKSLKLKDTKLKVRKLFGRIAERTESIREKVPQVALQNPFGHGQQTKFL
ncbi:hypothetical protein BC629DRAFT_353323 [Irpex lacteus]|nr:hypothetical protein BC629DRAFT_353323 [Irpex lacteus]